MITIIADQKFLRLFYRFNYINYKHLHKPECNFVL